MNHDWISTLAVPIAVSVVGIIFAGFCKFIGWIVLRFVAHLDRVEENTTKQIGRLSTRVGNMESYLRLPVYQSKDGEP